MTEANEVAALQDRIRLLTIALEHARAMWVPDDSVSAGEIDALLGEDE